MHQTLASRPRREPRAPLTPEQQGLALKFIPMAKSLAKPLKRAWPLHADEFDSAALFALVEAAQSFNPTRGVKFATFARYRIWGALRDTQRGLITAGWRGDPENMPTVSSLTFDAEELGTVLGASPDPPVGHELETNDLLGRMFRSLHGRHRQTCELIYGRGMSQGQAAEAMGISKSRVSYLHAEAIDILRYAMEDTARPDPYPKSRTLEVARHPGKRAKPMLA